MPTVSSALADAVHVTARCLRCGRTCPLDLAALVATGHGDVSLAELPLRCSGTMPEDDGPRIVSCDGRVFGFTVGAGNTGPQR